MRGAGLIGVLMLCGMAAFSQQVRKGHFIVGPQVSLSGNNSSQDNGFYYRYTAVAGLEYAFLQNTSAGIRTGISGSKTTLTRTGSYLFGPFIRQYVVKGLNIQAGYMVQKGPADVLLGAVAYGFEAGRCVIFEPYVEYGRYVKGSDNEDYLRFGMGLRFIL